MSESVSFDSLKLPIPESTKIYSHEQQKEMYQYLSEMCEHERKGYEIAVNHLGTSFNISANLSHLAFVES